MRRPATAWRFVALQLAQSYHAARQEVAQEMPSRRERRAERTPGRTGRRASPVPRSDKFRVAQPAAQALVSPGLKGHHRIAEGQIAPAIAALGKRVARVSHSEGVRNHGATQDEFADGFHVAYLLPRRNMSTSRGTASTANAPRQTMPRMIEVCHSQWWNASELVMLRLYLT